MLCSPGPDAFPLPAPRPLGAPGLGRAPLGGGDVEDGADSQEEASQHSAQLRDQVELHHLTQVRVVTGGVGLELSRGTKSIMSNRLKV